MVLTDSRPMAPPLDLDALPAKLRAGKRFVAYRFEDRGEPKPAKVPYSPDSDHKHKLASSTAPAHWITLDEAVRYAQVAHLNGIMRAFDPADGMVGIDLDNCRDPDTGELAPWAAEYVRRLDTYTEVSPSETGIKLWAYGTLPPSGRKKPNVEMYDRSRFFTLTGRHLEGTPREVKYRPDAVLAIHREVFGDAPVPTATLDPDRPVPALQLGDEEVLRLASESPHNGARFRRLWSGDTSDYAADGNDGASEADGALCELLAYYGGPDPDRIKRLFPRSRLYREKWDRLDYQERTIALALRGKTRFYGAGLAPSPPASDGAPACTCESCPAVAEVARLRRLALDRDDQLERHETTIRIQLARLTELRERLIGWKTVLSNPKLKPADRIVAIPVIESVRAAQRTGQSEVHVRYPGIVKGWGIPESTVQKSVAVVTDMAGAPLAKRNEQDRIKFPDPETGQMIEATPMKTLVRATVEGDLYKAVGAYAPNLPTRGGKRTSLPACPDHPEADVTLRTVPHCATCRKVLGAAKETTLCRLNEGVGGSPPPVAVPGNYRRQNEAIGAEADELAARRAAAAVAIPLGRAPDRWKRPHEPEPEPVSLGPIKLQSPVPDPPGLWCCDRCGALERYVDTAGQDRCDGCTEVIAS